MQTRTKYAGAFIAAVAAALFTATPAHAIKQVVTNIVSGYDSRYEQLTDPAYTAAPLSMGYSVGTGSVLGIAEHGVLRWDGRIAGRSDRLTPSGTSYTGGQIAFNDTLKIDAAGRTGQIGRVIIAYRIDGDITLNGGSKFVNAGYQVSTAIRSSVGGADDNVPAFRKYGDGTSDGTNVLGTTREIESAIKFGEEFEIGTGLNSLDARVTQQSPADASFSAVLKMTYRIVGVVSVKDASGNPVSGYELTSRSGTTYGPRKLWAAGVDLITNEIADAPEEKNSTNATNPMWSYGYRSGALGTAFTPFAPEQHQNGVGHPEVDGWSAGAAVLANTAGADVTLALDGVTSKTVRAGQLVLQPSATQYAVVRWVAPEKGTYSIAARWADIDASGGNGAAAHVVVNGVEVAGEATSFDPSGTAASSGYVWPNGGQAEMPPRSFRFEAGDKVDFVVGAAGDATADRTAFNAVIRRTPSIVLAAPAMVVAGQDLRVTASPGAGDSVKKVALRINGRNFGTDAVAPFEFICPNLTPGVYHIEAEAVDASKVLGASNALTVTVLDAPVSTAATKSVNAGNGSAAAASAAGNTYEAITSGLWSQADIWKRKSDGANGIPGPADVAIVGRAVQVTLTENVTVRKLYCEGRVAGDAGNTRGLTVTDELSMFGLLRDLTVNIPETGTFSNVRGAAFLENAKVNCRGNMVLSQSLYGGGSDLKIEGSAKLRTPPASGGPVTLAVNALDLGGSVSATAGSRVVTSSAVIRGTVSLVGADGASLVGSDGASLIGADGASLVGADGASLVGADGASLVGADGASLVGADGASLGKIDSASFITGSGSTVGNDASVAAAAPAGSGQFVFAGGTLTGTGNFVGNVVNNGAFFSPGNSGGIIRIIGNYSQGQQATTVLEIGGKTPNPPQFDQLQISGTASLAGSLIVRTINNYTPPADEPFIPILYSSASGNFDKVTSNAQVSVGANGVTLQISGPNPPPAKL